MDKKYEEVLDALYIQHTEKITKIKFERFTIK